MSRFQVISIVGPTAVGKTALALKIAETIPAEIVSLDAYQIYRGMDIGTAKASRVERDAVRHHLIDVVEIDYPATIADFHSWAVSAINEINAQNKTAICVGGSGLYVQSVLEVLDIPPTDPVVRQKFNDLAAEIGANALHQKLQQIDPAAASQISVGNTRRIVRALEVNEITGKSFVAELKPNPPRFNDIRIGLEMPRADLNARIADRVRQMVDAGWVPEVESLLAQGLLDTPTAVKAIGYREIAAVIAGDSGLEAAITQTIQATTRFGKRQMSWFQRDPKIHWTAPSKFDLSVLV